MSTEACQEMSSQENVILGYALPGCYGQFVSHLKLIVYQIADINMYIWNVGHYKSYQYIFCNEVVTSTSKSLYLYHILILILSSDRIWGLSYDH